MCQAFNFGGFDGEIECSVGFYTFNCMIKQPAFAANHKGAYHTFSTVNFEENTTTKLMFLPVAFNANKQIIYINNKRLVIAVLKMLIKLKACESWLVYDQFNSSL